MMLAEPPGILMRVNPVSRSSVHSSCRYASRTCWTRCQNYNEGPPRSNCVVPPGRVMKRATREL
jgi:hypothetical protein